MSEMKRFMAIMIVVLLMLTGCSNEPTPNEANNIDLQQKESEEKTPSQIYSNGEKANPDEENTDSDENAQNLDEKIYGRVKSIVGNEVEIELGKAPDGDGSNEVVSEDKKKPGASSIKVVEKENPSGVEDYYAPDPSDPIYGENGEINLIYADKSKTLTIQAGTKIRNILGKTATLEEIKKGSILMVTPKIVDGKDAGIEMLTIIK
jgi:hypothetical protein